MKIIIGALALAFAYPAAAQTAPASSDPRGHAEHQPGQMSHEQNGQHQSGHQGQPCCCRDEPAGADRRDCCDGHGQPQAGHEAHNHG